MSFDVAVIETGNGGDLQLVGNDLGIVYSIQNMLYLAWFGGNIEQDTKPKVEERESLDYWGNLLFNPSTQSAWFNSLTERTLNNTALTSSGRVIIENAMKKDLDFLSDLGVEVTLEVSIIATDWIQAIIKAVVNTGQKIVVVNFKKKSDGDFWIPDFNNDFYL